MIIAKSNSKFLAIIYNFNFLFIVFFFSSISHNKLSAVLKKQYEFYKVLTVLTHVQSQYFNNTAYLRKYDYDKHPIIINNKTPSIKVNVWCNMTVLDLAKSTNRSVKDVLEVLYFLTSKKFQRNDVLNNINIIGSCCKALGTSPIWISTKKIDITPYNEKLEQFKSPPVDMKNMVKRRPIVTIMGHVDHGKTTLLDTIRNTSVVSSEFGGITQHIGAFNVTLDTGEKITFLDTPGHAAFSSMRLRGAYITDIVVLVVAADDGVMEQTIQSLEMAKTANVPVIVAINKIDSPKANIQRTESMLAQNGIHLECLGGDVQSVNISALKNINLDQLLEAIIAQAEIMDLKGDSKGNVEGIVVESTIDSYRGKLATVLIKRGTLKTSDCIVSGLAWAKVRSMFDHAGNIVKTASLCDPVQIIGWRSVPQVGDEILQVKNEKVANMLIDEKMKEDQRKLSVEHGRIAQENQEEYLNEYRKKLLYKRTTGQKYRNIQTNFEFNKVDNTPALNIIVKADVAGSVEAILDTLDTYKEDKKCRLSLVHYNVGLLTETDIDLASSLNAIIYCFNVKGGRNIKKNIPDNVKIRHFNVIYKMIDDIKEEIIKLLPFDTVEDVIGEAEVLKVFEINEKRKKVNVAGCLCSKGELKKAATFKLIRRSEVIFTGKLKSMRHIKNEVTSIKTGVECGLMFEDAGMPLEVGDKITCIIYREKRRTINWNPGF